MFERYNEPARRVIFFARYEAVQRSSDRITPAHLLLGLIRENDSRADAVGSLKAKIPAPANCLESSTGPPRRFPLIRRAALR
ncbi:MAG: Clp protease N-terminal domain-containing protein [Terracidiphilus sp.]